MGFWSVGPGTSSIMDLATTHDIRILPITAKQQAKVLAANKTYAAVDLSTGVYRGVDKPVPTIGVWNVMIVQKSLDTELVYNLVNALWNHRDYLMKIHPRRPTPPRRTRSSTAPSRCIRAPSRPSRSAVSRYPTS